MLFKIHNLPEYFQSVIFVMLLKLITSVAMSMLSTNKILVESKEIIDEKLAKLTVLANFPCTMLQIQSAMHQQITLSTKNNIRSLYEPFIISCIAENTPSIIFTGGSCLKYLMAIEFLEK